MPEGDQEGEIIGSGLAKPNGIRVITRAEERLAAFLLNLTQRLQARGFSANALVLRMTREEIGSYLGLKLETVSRAFRCMVFNSWAAQFPVA